MADSKLTDDGASGAESGTSRNGDATANEPGTDADAAANEAAVEPYTDIPATDPESPVLELDAVSKQYGSEKVIRDLSLSVAEGEILTLLGPSGCGKTTTLRLVAGLERPDAGEVRVDGRTVVGPDTFVSPEERGVGLVFQEFALFPHLTAAENVAFGLQDLPDDEREARVDELLDLVGLSDQADSRPSELSGGQQQRVALARSLAPEPEILLLDEPFSNLDVDLRIEMREEVRRIIKEAGVTAVSVTHDQEEAMSISDRVAVVNDGRIEQIGQPERVFQHPKSRFVAAFLGHAGFLPGYVHGDEVITGIGSVPRSQIHGLAEEYDRTRIDVLVRPDDLKATQTADEDGQGRVLTRRYLGPTILYEVSLDGHEHNGKQGGATVQCMHNHDETLPLDARVSLSLQAEHELSWFPAEQRTDG